LLLATPQELERRHELTRLPPKQVLVTAEAIEREGRQLCQAQETIGDSGFQSVLLGVDISQRYRRYDIEPISR